ncbi:DUF2335 domain-containing protein [Pseudomonas gingeri]
MKKPTDTSDDREKGEKPSFSRQDSEQTIITAEISQELKAAVEQLGEANPAVGALIRSNEGAEVLETLSTVALSFVQEYHSAPYPSARQLQSYNLSLTDGANRLFSLTENEQKQRHAVENREQDLEEIRLKLKQELLQKELDLNYEIRLKEMVLQKEVQIQEVQIKGKSLDIIKGRDQRSQYLAAGLSCAVLAIGFWLMNHDQHVLGAGLIATNLVGIAVAFLTERRKKIEERTE